MNRDSFAFYHDLTDHNTYYQLWITDGEQQKRCKILEFKHRKTISFQRSLFNSTILQAKSTELKQLNIFFQGDFIGGKNWPEK